MNYLLDTNVIIAFLRGEENVKKRIEEAVLGSRQIFINGISYYEIKRGLLAANATAQLGRFDLLCKTLGWISLDNPSVFDRAAEIYAVLRQKGELMNDADILIAAIASIYNFILVTDDGDFNRIDGLTIENWL